MKINFRVERRRTTQPDSDGPFWDGTYHWIMLYRFSRKHKWFGGYQMYKSRQQAVRVGVKQILDIRREQRMKRPVD